MKKFLLSSAFALLIAAAFAQPVPCPTSFKRNNGNNCALGGGITLTFAANAVIPANLQILLVTPVGFPGSATVIETTKSVTPNGTGITWCFETDNLPPANNTSAYQVTFYIDGSLDGVINNQFDPGEKQSSCTEGTLPVTLVGFNAAQRSNKVNLSWETLFELNNDGFEIERRIGGGAYQKIAFVDSKAPGGNGDAFSYSFEDATSLPKGVTYYRLRQVDLDGRATYSEIKAVRTGNGTIILSVYPNPSRGTTNVALPSGVGTYDVSLDDFTGKSVQRFSGLTSSNLQLNNLKPGMYMLRVSIRATGETITERIAVQ
ncbi:T9SS type A sorting domain-containing protein [Lacibacter sp. H375]|uniref:T9SS type A sorting domain-containing protein n=1 Tax=Lacibacter sp. H375 TaxID=3133424 RepID=UPI0030BA611E